METRTLIYYKLFDKRSGNSEKQRGIESRFSPMIIALYLEEETSEFERRGLGRFRSTESLRCNRNRFREYIAS